MELNKLLRNNLRKYSAYEPGEQPKESGWLKLNTNENPYPPSNAVIKAIRNIKPEMLRRYPNPTAKSLI